MHFFFRRGSRGPAVENVFSQDGRHFTYEGELTLARSKSKTQIPFILLSSLLVATDKSPRALIDTQEEMPNSQEIVKVAFVINLANSIIAESPRGFILNETLPTNEHPFVQKSEYQFETDDKEWLSNITACITSLHNGLNVPELKDR